MALPTVADLRLYLDADPAEDGLLTVLLADARAWLVAELGRPILAADQGTGTGTTTGATVARGWKVLGSQRALVGTTPATVTLASSGSASATLGATPLESEPDYATVIEPALRLAVRDLAADLYQRRSPGASAESEAGVSVDWAADAIPPRAARIIALYGVRG